MNLGNIYPLIVPSDYYRPGTFDLPHYKFRNPDFILSWVHLNVGMIYITQDIYNNLNKKHENWQSSTFDNLRIASKKDQFFTHYQKNKRGQLLFIGFLNSDGIGSSRVLLSAELNKAFPNGYHIAFPDRSWGLVISKDIDENDQAEVSRILQNMYKQAPVAMSADLYNVEEFELPAQWVTPIDLRLTDELANHVKNLTLRHES